MSERDQNRGAWSGPRRYRWDSPEFARVTSLSDGVFAIALTLLVLALDVPDVDTTDLAGALLSEGQQVALFALSFVLVANIWWVHHRFIALLGELESGLIVVNLMILGLVALVTAFWWPVAGLVVLAVSGAGTDRHGSGSHAAAECSGKEQRAHDSPSSHFRAVSAARLRARHQKRHPSRFQ